MIKRLSILILRTNEAVEKLRSVMSSEVETSLTVHFLAG